MNGGANERRVELEAAGPLTTIQDLGRPGYAAQGIGPAGAADPPALRLANALVGNADNAAGLEFTLLGPTLRFLCDVEIALAGALFECTLAGKSVPCWAPIRVSAGSRLKIGGTATGCRGYLAIGGGIAVAPVLGSRSQDVNSRIGPLNGQPLANGTRLPLGTAPAPGVKNAGWSLAAPCWKAPVRPLTLPLMPATHTDCLDAASRRTLFEHTFRIGQNSNRVGCRLESHALKLKQSLEMISAAVLPGTVQLPPSGTPIAMLCEAPVTGGYPRIGHIAQLDLTRLAQLKPGDEVRFTPVTVDKAQQQYLQRERELRALQAHIAKRRTGTWP